MATPIIQSSGSLSGPGTVGQGRDDLQIGETVTLTDVEGANGAASYVWAFENIPEGSSSVLNNAMTASPNFVPDTEGSYRVRATVNGISFSVKIYAVPLPVTGARIPSFEEESQYDGGGNTRGWHTAMDQWMRAVDSGVGGGGSDPNAIHDNIAAEISAIANKAAPLGADVLVIEDSAAAFAKKSILASTLQTDPNAVHTNVAAEILAVAEKVAPIAADLILIEDSAAANAKKRIQVGNLPGVGGGNNLEQAYNQGGAGVGRTINAITGAVVLQSAVANNDNVLELFKSHVGGVPQSGYALSATLGPLISGHVVHITPGNNVVGAGGLLVTMGAGASASAKGIQADILNVGGIALNIALGQATTQGIKITNSVPNTGSGLIDVDVISGSSTGAGISVNHAGSGWAASFSNSGTGVALGVSKAATASHGIRLVEGAPAPENSLLGIRAAVGSLVPMLSIQKNTATAAAAQMIYAEDNNVVTEDMVRMYHRGSGHAIQITHFTTSVTPAFYLNAAPAVPTATHGMLLQGNANVQGELLEITQAGTGYALKVTQGVSKFNGAAGSRVTTLADAAVIATNAALANVFEVTLTANRVLGAPTNLEEGFTYVWIIHQDVGGTNTLDVSNAIFLWDNGGTEPVIAAGGSEISVFSGVYDGTSLHMFYGLNLA